MNRTDRGYALTAVFIVVAIILTIGVMAHDAYQCEKRGGQLVRGLLWYVCITPNKNANDA